MPDLLFDPTAAQCYLDGLLRHETLNLTRLKTIGQGGSHRVYLADENAPYIIKIPLSHLPDAQASAQSLSLDNPVRLRQEQQRMNEEYEKLYRYLGTEFCLQQLACCCRFGFEESSGKTRFVSGLAIVQQRESGFNERGAIELSSPYIEAELERFPYDREAYLRMNLALLGTGSFALSDYLGFNDKARRCFEMLGLETKFKRSIRIFLERLKRYALEQDRMIDFVGRMNVFALKREGQWLLRIGSVLRGRCLDKTRKLIDSLTAVPLENLSHEDRLDLMNGLAFLRLTNALALAVNGEPLFPLQYSRNQLLPLERLRFR